LLLLGVEEYCAKAGYYLLFARHQFAADTAPDMLQIPSVIETPGLADCVIIVGTISPNILAALAQHGLKYVLLANHVAGPGSNGIQSAQVQYNDEAGCYEAVRYLAQLGHRDIWYIGDASRPWHQRRYKGYARGMAELAIEPHAHTIALSDDEFENGQAAVSYILEQGWPVTAILAASDELAFGAREGLRQHRREVPKDVSLVGFEHRSGHASGSNLTTISVDMVEVGRHLAKLAIAQIESEKKEIREVGVPTLFVKRSSCRPLRKEEQMLL
jgi:DNA-binding LacI/PurR family transcriptional regulator